VDPVEHLLQGPRQGIRQIRLVEVDGQRLILTERGRPFLRNACMFFDQRLRRQEQRPQVFSQAL